MKQLEIRVKSEDPFWLLYDFVSDSSEHDHKKVSYAQTTQNGVIHLVIEADTEDDFEWLRTRVLEELEKGEELLQFRVE